jgi:hypothetical protein
VNVKQARAPAISVQSQSRTRQVRIRAVGPSRSNRQAALQERGAEDYIGNPVQEARFKRLSIFVAVPEKRRSRDGRWCCKATSRLRPGNLPS